MLLNGFDYVIVYFLVDSFWLIKKKTICLITFNKLSALFPAFSFARAIGNLWSICLDVNILSPVPLVALASAYALDIIKE